MIIGDNHIFSKLDTAIAKLRSITIYSWAINPSTIKNHENC